MKKTILFLLMLCAMIPAYAAHAATPACIANHLKATAPHGTATLNKLIFHVYDAQFWSDNADKWDANTPHALHLTYFVDIESADFVERSLEELQRNPAVTKAMLAAFARALPPIMPNVVEGDSITAVYTPTTGAIFCHNNKAVGSLQDPAMAQAFFGIWLSEHTSEPRLRKALLGH